jgi:uncharacterized protein
MKNNYNEMIKELTDKELTFHLYVTQVLLLIVSFILGLFLFKDFSYLKLIKWDDFQIIKFGVPSGILVVLIDVILMKQLPSSYYNDGGLNERIFRNKSTLQIAWITAIVAFSEEMLFRGMIQTKFGLIIASIVFALIHYRYLFNWFLLLNIILLSFLIGFIYVFTNNLAVTIVMHFVIDFLLGIFIKKKSLHEQEGLFHE